MGVSFEQRQLAVADNYHVLAVTVDFDFCNHLFDVLNVGAMKTVHPSRCSRSQT
jgi:hypothetical protein